MRKKHGWRNNMLNEPGSKNYISENNANLKLHLEFIFYFKEGETRAWYWRGRPVVDAERIVKNYMHRINWRSWYKGTNGRVGRGQCRWRENGGGIHCCRTPKNDTGECTALHCRRAPAIFPREPEWTEMYCNYATLPSKSIHPMGCSKFSHW